MKFRAKDLMISVVPKAEIDARDIAKYCYIHTRLCLSPTFCVGGTLQCQPCTFFVTCNCTVRGTVGCGFGNSCGPGGSACDPTIFCFGSDPFIIEDLEDLVTIRKELQQTLTRLEEVEREGQTFSIRTRDQAEDIERGLTQALEQVRRAKENLR